jgi:ribosomal-protein-alanine N-acetyltransferase
MGKFPRLQTERLILRELEPTDQEFVHQHFADPDITFYLHDEEPIATRQEAQAIIDFYTEPGTKSYHRWVIVNKQDYKPIGTCGFHKWEKRHSRVEIGYDLDKEFWNKGFMTEALIEVLKFVFTNMEVNRIEALVHPHNLASIKLLEKLRFQKEGLMREYYFQMGKFHDSLIFSLLRKEWHSTKFDQD